jgi:hypothetical protein
MILRWFVMALVALSCSGVASGLNPQDEFIPIPEPGTWVLVCTGVGLFFLQRWRRK